MPESGRQITIALVDDNEANRYAVARMLAVAGFSVREGASIADGARLAAEEPDLVILDIRLPDGSGFDLCRRLRADPATRDLPLLLISASFTGSEWKAEALSGGADGYLTHPVEPPELIATVRALLRARDAEQRARLAAREWTATFDALSDAICVTKRDGEILRCNRAFADLVGASFAEIIGREVSSLVPGLADGGPNELTIGPRTFRVSVHASRGNGADAPIARVLTDITERKQADARIGELLTEERRAREAAEAAAARDAFLADAGNILASSLDYETTLVQVATLAAERFVNWCAVDVRGPDDRMRRLVMAHADPERVAAAWHVYEHHPGSLDGVAALRDMLDSRRPKIVRHVTDATLRGLATGADHLDALRGLGVTSYLAVPLLLRDRVLGAITFALDDDERRFSSADLAVAARLASKVALAIDNVRLFQDVEAAVRRKDETLAFLNTVLSTAPVGLAFVDRELSVVRINNALAEMVGRPADGHLDRAVDDVAPAEWEHFTDYFRKVLETGEPILDLEWSAERADRPGRPSRVQHVIASYYPIRGADGAVAWVGVVVNDVTERRRAEEAVRQAQKLESIGLLAGGIAHDFNNLLTGILGNASLARRAIPAGNAAAPMLADVVRASERAAALTSQLLAYAGKGRFYVQPIDLAKLVRDITGLLHTSLPKKVKLHIDLDPSLPMIEADAGQLQQVVMNLVINAAEAIGDAAGTAAVAADTMSLDEAALREQFPTFHLTPGTYVRLVVRDTGVGMDDVTLTRIFDPFFTTKFTGRGLGLAAVLGIIRGHKGGIAVESEPGHGTTFTVVLPALEVQPPAELPPGPARGYPGSGTVLVADDEEIVRRIARKTLEECGFSVLEAVNGLEAVDLARRHGNTIILALLDMTMPVMGGDEAVRHLKRLRPNLPVIAMSGYGELEAIRRFTGTGIDGFLQKPYTAEQLLERLEVVLSTKQ